LWIHYAFIQKRRQLICVEQINKFADGFFVH
jgi:hypothetical protein